MPRTRRRRPIGRRPEYGHRHADAMDEAENPGLVLEDIVLDRLNIGECSNKRQYRCYTKHIEC